MEKYEIGIFRMLWNRQKIIEKINKKYKKNMNYSVIQNYLKGNIIYRYKKYVDIKFVKKNKF